MQDDELLAATRAGDADAFPRLVEPHRAQLHAHGYRMLGSLYDAEDVFQEAMLRAWRGFARFDGRSAVRTWLYRITTDACLDAIARRPKRVLPVDYGPAGSHAEPGHPSLLDGNCVEPYPDEVLQVEEGYATPEARYEQREAVELAFVAAIQLLPPRRRAVPVLREVLGCSAGEVAAALDTTSASMNSALQRARTTVERRIPERSERATVRSLGHGRVRRLAERLSDAFSLPPYPGRWRGRAAIADSWLMPGGPPPRLRSLPARANGQPAVAAYRDGSGYMPLALGVITLRGAWIVDVTAFRAPELFPRFDLPEELAA